MLNFLKRRIMIVTLVTIIILITIGSTYGGRNNITLIERSVGNFVTPVQKFLTLGGNFLVDIIKPVTKVWKLDEENKQLKNEITRLHNKIIELKLTRQELRDLQNLREALNYSTRNGIDNFITCNVIAKNPGNWYNMFTIDAGLKQGITKNSTVINGDGLIGLVYEVSDNWAKVVSIIDNKSRVSFEVLDEPNSYIGIVNGQGKSDLTGYLIDPQAEVKEGTEIITSGIGIYPKGIKIGRIDEVIVNKEELLKTVIVKPFVNFKRIDRVFVIPEDNIDR